MEKIVKLHYGNAVRDFDISELKLLGILEPHHYPKIDNQEEAIYNAIRSPLYGPPLLELARNKKSAVILVSDKTRRTLAKEILPILLEELSRGGIPLSRITIIIAVGAHPMLTEDEMKLLLGEEIISSITVINHNCRDFSSLEYRGTSPRGTPIYINRVFLDAELKILTGAINYHDFAGFSGGAKSVLPGISGFSTISHNHLLLLNPSFGTGYNPMATAGILDGNPVHEDMEDITSLINPDFLINVVFNKEGELSQIVSGNWRLAHRAGCKTIERIFSAEVDEKADVVLVSAGGYPFDINFYQAMKSIINTMGIVKDDGAIILVASCVEGLGTHHLKEWLSIDSPVMLEKDLRENFNMIGKIAYDIKIVLRGRRVVMITELPEEDVNLLGFKKAKSLEEAMDLLSLRDNSTIYVVPFGNITVAKRTIPL
jgi:nickel-dependent lactate racemase